MTTRDVVITTIRRRRERRIKNKGGEDFDVFALAICIGRCLTVGSLVLGRAMFSFWHYGNVEEKILG